MRRPPQRRPRILVTTSVPETLAAFLVPQLQSLCEAGFDVHAVSSPGPALDNLAIGSGIVRHGIPIERRPHPLKDSVSLWHMFRLIRDLRPHVVHAHTPKAGLIGMAAATLARVPARLYTIHGLPLLTRSGPWRRVLEFAERASCSLSTQNYAVSESVRELLVDLKLCRASRVTVLGDGGCAGVDVARFCPAAKTPGAREAARRKFGIPDNALLVTFVGRLARDKGIAVLAEAWPAAAREIPELHLMLVGERDASDPVPESVFDSLRQHERVHFAGGAEAEDMPGVYSATDIGVLPTFREGLGQTALEAAAAGLPMVSTRVSGVVNAIEDGVTGLLVPPGDAEVLSRELIFLAKDGHLRRKLGEAARVRVVARFSQDRVNRLWMEEYARLLETILPNRGPSVTGAGWEAGRSDAF